MNYENTTLHWILDKFLKDNLQFLSEDIRVKGMKRMDWINEWIEKEYPKTMVYFPKNKKGKEDINKWKKIVEELHNIVDTIGWHECSSTEGKCSPEIIHAIIHVNHARKELQQAIEAINERVKDE